VIEKFGLFNGHVVADPFGDFVLLLARLILLIVALFVFLKAERENY
jgi:hypothetical protein